MIDIQNVVAKVSLRQRLNINKLSTFLPPTYTVQFKPAVFPGAVVKEKGSVTFLLFKTGNAICVGSKSVGECVAASEKLYTALVKSGAIKDRGFEIDITNIVARADFGTPLDINTLAETLEHTIYEPEIFPGMICYLRRPKVTILLFQNGKAVIAGARSEDEVEEVYKNLTTKIHSAKEVVA